MSKATGTYIKPKSDKSGDLIKCRIYGESDEAVIDIITEYMKTGRTGWRRRSTGNCARQTHVECTD